MRVYRQRQRDGSVLGALIDDTGRSVREPRRRPLTGISVPLIVGARLPYEIPEMMS
jgi:hypothetical protein